MKIGRLPFFVGSNPQAAELSGLRVKKTTNNNFHETNRLNLQTDKSFRFLNWRPKWDFENSVKRTIEWYKKIQNSNITAREVCLFDIEEYMDT